MKTWRIGTRGSPLALAQAGWVRSRLQGYRPHDHFELVAIKTVGDKQGQVPVEGIDAKGIFTREIEEALLAGKIDLAVHSLKDLPVDLPAGLVLGPVPGREDPRDALISKDRKALEDMPPDARVGTGSGRRKAQVLQLNTRVKVTPLRGNVQTRISRVRQGDLEGVVLAMAGLIRLGLGQEVSEVFEADAMLPAVGQGALGLEHRKGDSQVHALLKGIQDTAQDCALRAERAFLRALGGGCRVPIGAFGRCEDGKVTLSGGVFSQDGKQTVRGRRQEEAGKAEQLGEDLARELLAKGAARILGHG